MLIQALGHLQSFGDVIVDIVLALERNHPAGFSLCQQTNRLKAHIGGGDPVPGGGGAAALDVTQHRDTGVQGRGLLNDLAHGVGAALHALGHNNHEVRASPQAGPADGLQQIDLIIHRMFGHDHSGGAAGHTHVQSQMTRTMAHNLYHRAALVGLHGIPQLVDGLQGRVAGGVIADGVAGTGDVVVDGAGNTYHGDAALRQTEQALEGTVAANTHQSVQPQHFAGCNGPFLSGGGLELLAAGGIEHGAAPAGQIAHALKSQLGKIPVDQPMIPTTDAHALDAHMGAGSGHRTDGGVHAGGVSPAGQNADSAYSFFHLCILLKPSVPSLFHGGRRRNAPAPAGHHGAGNPPPAPDSGRCSAPAPDGR